MPANPLVIPIGADYKSAQQASKTFLATLKSDLDHAQAQINVALAKGLVTPEQAKAQGHAAGVAFQKAVIEAVGSVHADTGLDDAARRGAITTLGTSLRALKEETSEAAKGFGALTLAVDAAGGPLGGLSARVRSVTGVLGSVPAAVGLTAAALTAVIANATAMAIEVEGAARRVDVALNLTGDQAAAMRADLRAFSVEFGQSQVDIAAVMKTVADNGPGSAEGLRAMTRAALELAKVTGGDANGIAAGLDGVIDAFGRSAEEAESVAAAVFAITRGKVPLQDLFATLDTVAARAAAAGLSLEDVTGAVAAMRDANIPVRQIKTELENLVGAGQAGAERIRELAGGARDAAKDTQAFGAAIKSAKDNANDLAKVAKQQLAAALINLGNVVLPTVNEGLKEFNNTLESITKRDYTRAAQSLAELLAPLRGAPVVGSLLDPEALRALGRGAQALSDARRFAFPDAAPAPTKGTPIAGLLTPTATATTAGAAGDAKAVADRVRAITAATEDLGKVAPARVRAFIAELQSLKAQTANVKLGDDIVALVAKLQRELPSAGKTLAEEAKRLHEKVIGETAAMLKELAEAQAKLSDTPRDALGAQVAGQLAELDRLGEKLRALQASPTANQADTRAAIQATRDLIAVKQELVIKTVAQATAEQQTSDDTARAAAELAGRLTAVGDEIDALAAQASTQHVGGVILSDEDLARVETLRKQLVALKADPLAVELLSADQRKALDEALTKLGRIHDITLGTGTAAKDTARHTRDWVDSMAQGARALLEASSAAGLLDDRMSRVANSAITLAESLSKAIQSKGADIGADITAIASAANLVKGVFGKSAAEVQRDRTLEANTRALEALTRRAGDLSGLTVSGANFGLARDVVGSIVGQTAGRKDSQKITNVGDLFNATGLSADDLTAIAKSLGITIDGTVGSYRKLYEAIKAADFKAFTDSWAGAVQEFELLTRIDGVTDPGARLVAYAKTVIDKSGSSLLTAFLQGATLTTPEGRAAARKAARNIVQQIIDGTIDPEAFGKLNQGEVLQFLEAFIGDIDAVPSAAAQASRALDVLNGTLSDIALLGEFFGKSAESVFDTIDALTTAFPELGEALSGLLRNADLTTADGRAAFKANVANLAQNFAIDGLTEAERAALQALAPLLQWIDALGAEAGAATPAVQGLSSAVTEMADAAQAAVRAVLATAQAAATDAKRLGKTPVQQQQAEADAIVASLPGVGKVNVRDAKSIQGALDVLRPAYASLGPGDLKELFGGAIDFLVPLLDELGAGKPPVGVPSSGDPNGVRTQSAVSTLTNEQGAAFIALQRSQLIELQSIDARLASLSASALIPIPAPAYPASLMASGGGSVTINAPVQVTVQAQITAGGDLAPAQGYVDGFAQGIGAGVGSSLDAQLGDRFRVGNFFAGNRATGG